MIDERALLDSSVWLSYFFAENEISKKFVEDGKYLLMTSVLSVFEIKRKLLKMKIKESKIGGFLGFIKTRSLIIDLNERICNDAVDLSIKHNLHTVDSLIYCSAILNNATLISGDNHFNGLENTFIIE